MNQNELIQPTPLWEGEGNHFFTNLQKKDISKNKVPFNQFKSDLAFLAKNDFDFEKLLKAIEKQNNLIEKHSTLLENFAKNNLFVERVVRDANIEGILKETDNKIIDIQNQLKQMIG